MIALTVTTKEEILASLEADLKLIAVANGYANNVQLVERQREDWDEITAEGQMVFPFIFINDMRDDVEQQLLSDLYRRRLVVGLVCAITVDPVTGHSTMSTNLNSLIGDVGKALAANPYRVIGGKRTVYLTVPDACTTDEGFLFPEAVAIQTYHFIYFSAA